MEGQLETVKLSDMKKAEKYLSDTNRSDFQKLKDLCSWDDSSYLIVNPNDVSFICPLCPYEERKPIKDNEVDIRS